MEEFWSHSCLSCPVGAYWGHLCSEHCIWPWQLTSGIWHLASDIWHLTSGKLKTASGHYNWQVGYHTERQCSKPGLDTERLYWVCLCSSKSGKSVLDTIIIISSPPLFWQIEDSACPPVVTSPPSKRGSGTIQQCTHNTILPYMSQYNNTIRGTIQQYTHNTQHLQQAAQYNNILTICGTYNLCHIILYCQNCVQYRQMYNLYGGDPYFYWSAH